MSVNRRSLEMINKIIAGGKKPDFDELNSDGISKSTHLTYCDTAVRLRAYFGRSDQPFQSIGQMKRLGKLCAGKKRIHLFSKIPQASLMSKASLIRVIEQAATLVTDSEEVRGFLLLPDVSRAKKIGDVTNVAKDFVYKLYMLNVTTYVEFALIAESELISMYESTRSKWGEFLGAEFEKPTAIKFWLLVYCMIFEFASSKVNDPIVRAAVAKEMSDASKVRRGVHWGVDVAIRSAIQRGRLS